MQWTRRLAYASMVVATLCMAVLATGCCHCPPVPPPQPCAVYLECLHPKLGEVDLCLGDCDGAPVEAKATCQRNCCGLINNISQATADEKDALKRCRSACQ